MRTFWINRNYKYHKCNHGDSCEYTGGLWKAGEFHWRYDAECSKGGHISWHWLTNFCHIKFACETRDGYECVFSIGLPYLLSLWFVHTMPAWLIKYLPQHSYCIPLWDAASQTSIATEGSYPESREISLAIHSNALWWRVWFNDDEWHSTDPWYRRGSFDVADFVCGPREYICAKIGPPIHTHVCMPEGKYPVIVQEQEQRWWRKRFPRGPFRQGRRSFDVACEVGIPFPGKGENSWDCGEDAVFGASYAVPTVEEACARFAQTVLDNRRKYGGKGCAEQPWPESPLQRVQSLNMQKASRHD